jgi:arylsulfatase A-like enzyme
LDGLSIAPMLRGGIGEARQMLYWEIHHGGLGQAVRMGDWKVVRPPGKTRREDCELYNLKKDPKEQKNVSSRHPEIVAKFLK